MRRPIPLAAAALLAWLTTAPAQEQAEPRPVSIQAAHAPASIRPGGGK